MEVFLKKNFYKTISKQLQIERQDQSCLRKKIEVAIKKLKKYVSKNCIDKTDFFPKKN